MTDPIVYVKLERQEKKRTRWARDDTRALLEETRKRLTEMTKTFEAEEKAREEEREKQREAALLKKRVENRELKEILRPHLIDILESEMGICDIDFMWSNDQPHPDSFQDHAMMAPYTGRWNFTFENEELLYFFVYTGSRWCVIPSMYGSGVLGAFASNMFKERIYEFLAVSDLALPEFTTPTMSETESVFLCFERCLKCFDHFSSPLAVEEFFCRD